MEVEEPRRLERLIVGDDAALVDAVLSSRAADASDSSRSCGEEALIVAAFLLDRSSDLHHGRGRGLMLFTRGTGQFYFLFSWRLSKFPFLLKMNATKKSTKQTMVPRKKK